MNKNKHYDYEETQRLIERAHQRATGSGLGDININLLIKHNAWLFSELINKELEAYNLQCVGYAVLMTIYSTSENLANPSDICICTGESRANMTRICDELVEYGLVTRVHNPKDRRRVDLSLTEKGTELLNTLVPAVRQRAQAIFKVFEDSEKAILEAALLKLMHALESQV